MRLNAIKYVSFKRNITKNRRTAAGRQGRMVRTGKRRNIIKKLKKYAFKRNYWYL